MLKRHWTLVFGGVLCLFLAFFASPGDVSHLPPEMNYIHHGSFLKTAAPGQETSLLNWNIERGTEYEKIQAVIRKHNPDLCILQEVDLHARRSGDKDVAAALASEFGYDYAFGIEFQELSQGLHASPAYHGQAILSRQQLTNVRLLRFQNQSSFWQPSGLLPAKLPLFQRRIGGRIALIGEQESAGGKLVIYDLHLESRNTENLRLRQLEEVLADAGRYPADVTVLIAGDLNNKAPWSPVIPALRQAGFRSALGAKSVRTHAIVGSLDWIFVRGPGQLEGGAVHREDHGSDHYPVVARLRISASTNRISP
jgi:endonuclease/exonuclease/phosphatase family metal-dependent hydrolase